MKNLFSQFAAYRLTQVLNWVRSHDWGRDAGYDNGFVIFHDNEGKEQQFSDLESLNSWAGY